ncbi:MAG: hypothetical protein KJ626_00945 [Verrucomicrobia bacterium]|nr:hypothetical protein [Verrucomicrobiota bacterium]
MNARRSVRAKTLVPVLVIMCALSAIPCFAFDIHVNPGSIDWTSNLWVDVAISNITVGGEVDLHLFADINANGVVDAPDMLITTFELEDGLTNSLGADIIADDDDGTAIARIHTRISYHGSDYDIFRTIGSYIWYGVLNGSTITTATFEVTQSPTPVWITGSVRDYVPPSNKVAGAYVVMGYVWEHLGIPPATWSDTNGNFSLYVPSGIASDQVAGVRAIGFEYVSAENGPNEEPFSVYMFTEPLQNGENALTQPLLVASAAPGMLAEISGTTYDADSNILSGVFVELESSEEDGGDLMSIGVSDLNGDYSLLYPLGESADLFCGGYALNMRGLVGMGQELNISGDLSGMDLYIPRANALARSTVTEGGAPVTGAEIDFESDLYANSSYSVEGIYEVCLTVDTNYFAHAGSETLAARGYVSTSEFGIATLPAGWYTNAPFVLEKGRVLSGHVYDENTNAVGGGFVEAIISNTWETVGEGRATASGQYEILVGAGSYRLRSLDFAGYVDQVYDGHHTWEWNDGPVYDPVVVTTDDVGGVDFYLEALAEISGSVYGGITPLQNADVAVYAREWDPGGWWQLQFIGSVLTESNGTYLIGAPEGTNYVVECRPPEGTFWVGQFYDGMYRQDDADPIATSTGAPATDIDFDLLEGGIITGMVFEADGATPVPYARVEARHPAADDFAFGSSANDLGEYSFAVTAGTYFVAVYANGWPDQYYDGWFRSQWMSADPVTVVLDQYTNVTFEMLQSSRVEGRVMSPTIWLDGVQVEIWQGEDDRLGQTLTESNGYYSVVVPPATGCVALARSGADSTYLDQVWSNTSWSAPTYFDVPETSTVSGIDFVLHPGMRVEGYVLDELDVLMSEVDVALLWTNGHWAAGGRTDDSGHYYIISTGGVDYIVRARAELPLLYPSQFYYGSPVQTGATVVTPPTGTVLSNINFSMAPGYKVEGYVLDADGVTPAPNGYVQAQDTESNFYDGAGTDGSGWYESSFSRHRALYLGASATDRQAEYHMGSLDWGHASQLQPAAFTTSRIDFVLYNWTDDADGDGIPDYQEDTRPDGTYDYDEDATSWTNRDTDADGQDDYAEKNITFTDPEDGNDYLKCSRVQRLPSGALVGWRSNNGTWYTIQRRDDLVGGDWTDWAGAMGTGTYTTVFDGSNTARYNYRIKTQ